MKSKEFCKLCGSEKVTQSLGSSTFKILYCSACENYFTNPPPVAPAYEEMDFHANENLGEVTTLKFAHDLPDDWKRLVTVQSDLIRATVDTSADILEIGCGEGILLYELRAIGFTNIEGVEPSRTAFARAQQKGLVVHNGYLENIDIRKKFNVIVMSHVLEHIEQPVAFIRSLKQYLKPDGYLLLTQTNCEGLIPGRTGSAWYAWVPEQHFWHFTERGLKSVITRLGFIWTKTKYTSLVHPHDISYWISRFFQRTQDQFVIMFQQKK